MSYSGDAAEQVVRMSLEGTEVALKLAGSGAKQLATLLYAVLKDQKKTKGKTRLTNMLRSGKELKVFAVKDSELAKFCKEAKKYGVLYTVLKDKDPNDGITDIFVRAEDASKVNRIFERFNLATVDMGSVKTDIEREQAEKTGAKKENGAPEADVIAEEKPAEKPERDKIDDFIDELLGVKKKEEPERNGNPTEGRTKESHQSEPSSVKKTASERDDTERKRPSVRQELNEIKRQQASENAKKASEISKPKQHKAPPRKKRRKKAR